MESDDKTAAGTLLEILPPVEFCCIYGSTLHPNNQDKTSMVDYILGVADPVQWHAKNLKMNRNHYASWMVHLGGERMINGVANHIGVGVHFNPFVSWNNKMYKYGVIRVHDLIQDITEWEKFYLSGRLQKPVNTIVDNVGLERLNRVNLKSATSAALLLLPSKFTEEDLFAKICSLSYMGDLRMYFAEDKNKVKKIVQSQYDLFQTMYRPYLEEYATKDLLSMSTSHDNQVKITQDCGVTASSSFVSSLPKSFTNQMGINLGEKTSLGKEGEVVREVRINSKVEAAECMRKLVSRKVMVSSARQAVAGLLTVGAVHGTRYLANKMRKAWKSIS
ncbi:hypothetical protein Leryth_006141 [Lithospermum erythrorhizon]|nr:hypothetical protein Leryth_006141 [Lithospermum erythrorhizon]